MHRLGETSLTALISLVGGARQERTGHMSGTLRQQPRGNTRRMFPSLCTSTPADRRTVCGPALLGRFRGGGAERALGLKLVQERHLQKDGRLRGLAGSVAGNFGRGAGARRRRTASEVLALGRRIMIGLSRPCRALRRAPTPFWQTHSEASC